jgi:predicted RNA methylase
VRGTVRVDVPTGRDADALRERVRDQGFTPAARDVPGLLDLLGETDDPGPVFRALARVIEPAVAQAIARFDDASAAARARLCELVGRAARSGEASGDWLAARLVDPDAVVRRRAATALGKLEDPQHEPVLLAAWQHAQSDPERKVIAAALGQCGGAQALALLRDVSTTDAELARVVGESLLKIDRTLVRATPSSIALDTVPADAVAIELVVRPGLESLVCDAIAGGRPIARGVVATQWDRSLRELFAVRTFVELAMPLAPMRIAEPTPAVVEDAVVRILGSEAATRILTTFTAGPVRWRLDWKGQGHRRGSTWRIVESLALLRPELVNDPRDAPWEASVVVEPEARGKGVVVRIVLRPRGLDDPRFAWRRGSVPASSHPTIAAALAIVAGVRENDVVWDPFVGAGAELVERGLLGPHRALVGTDRDPAAIEIAQQNLDAAGLVATLAVGDATTWRPPQPPTLVITNPPMGHRVRGETEVAELMDRALSHWLDVVDAGARIVWLSPTPEQTAAHRGVLVQLRRRVDLGGLAAELQVLERRPGKRGV